MTSPTSTDQQTGEQGPAAEAPDLERVVDEAMRLGASFCDVRWEAVRSERISWKDGDIDAMAESVEAGLAIRVLVAGAWGFASSHDTSRSGWKAGVASATGLAKGMQAEQPVTLDEGSARTATAHWRPRLDALAVDVEEKVRLLRELESRVRVHPEIRSVQAAFSASILHKEYADSQGKHLEWSLPRTVAQVHFTARSEGHVAGRHTRVGATKGWEAFHDEDPLEKAERVARSTVEALDAPMARGGRQTVVIDPELAGVFAHEAVGHAAEADLVRAGESCFAGRIGDTIGVTGLTIHDDATMRGSFGAYPFDDNGVAASDRVLVEDGVLRGYLLDRENAGALGMQANGAARAQDHRHRPLVRMSTTLIAPGEHAEDEVFAGIKEGVYCIGSRGGQVDTARGTYLFNAQEAYRIEDGQVTTPLRDVSLSGDVLSTLHHIEALGDQARLGDPGYCGKGQWVPVCDGGPLIRIRDCLVGGAG